MYMIEIWYAPAIMCPKDKLEEYLKRLGASVKAVHKM